jgi:hypothetical protein
MGNKNIFTYLIYNLQIKTTNFHTINLENEDTQVYHSLPSFLVLFTATLIIFNEMLLESKPSQLFVSPSHSARRPNKIK